MQIRYRLGKTEDFLRGRGLLEMDRSLYSSDIWRLLPKLLQDLTDRGRIRGCVYENMGAPGELMCIGATGFLHPGFLENAMGNGGVDWPIARFDLSHRTTAERCHSHSRFGPGH